MSAADSVHEPAGVVIVVNALLDGLIIRLVLVVGQVKRRSVSRPIDAHSVLTAQFHIRRLAVSHKKKARHR